MGQSRANDGMTPSDVSAWVDQAARLLDLPIAEEHRPGVLHYFSIAADMAALVNEFPLSAVDEAAGAFIPVAPEPGDR